MKNTGNFIISTNKMSKEEIDHIKNLDWSSYDDGTNMVQCPSCSALYLKNKICWRCGYKGEKSK